MVTHISVSLTFVAYCTFLQTAVMYGSELWDVSPCNCESWVVSSCDVLINEGLSFLCEYPVMISWIIESTNGLVGHRIHRVFLINDSGTV